MSGLNPPLIFPRAVDHNGVPSPGAKLYATVTETSIPKLLYFDFAKTNPCPYPLVADSEGRFPQFFLEAGGYDFSVKDENGNLLRPPENHIFGASGEGGFPEPSGDTYMVKVDSDDAVPGFLSEKLEDSATVHWNVGDSTIKAEVQEGAGDTYKVKVNTEDATPGFLEDKLADTTDTQFSPTEDGKQLDNIVFQLTGLGSRLNRIKNVGFDFEQGPFPAASNAGGRGISFGRRFVAGVEVDAWVAQGNNGKLYWTSNNDSTRWVISEEDTAVYTEYPSGRAYYGWSCIKFVYVAGTHNCFCWLMGSGDIEQTIVFFEHKPENYNADGTIKASALDSVTYVGSTAGPRTVIDIMQVDTTGGIFLAGDDPRVGYTTDLSTFQLAMTAVDKNIGGFGFDGDITVQAIERDTGVIWRSTSYGVPGTFAKVPSFYLDNVLVSNFPMSQPSGTAAQWGSMFCMYGQWLSVNFSYVAGGIGFIYSDDGIYWYSSKDEATAFYDANNDGLRWFATNAVPNSGTPIFQLIVSMIPVHRRLSLEKGGVVSGPLILREFPNTPFLGTDHRGRIISGPANKVAGRDALGISTFMGTLLDDVDAATARATIGASSIAGSVSFETLFTGRRTVAVTNAVLSTLIPTKTFPANFWSAGKCVRGKIQMYSGHSAIISISLDGNEFANFSIPAVFRGELEFALTCETTGSTAKFAFCGTALGGSTSGTPVVGSPHFGDSTPTGAAWSDNWSINTANSSDLTIQIYPSYTEDVYLVHGSLTTFAP